MFDNFGLGELFFLAVLGLLFFGPDRLPGMGAKVGRWIASMTQYSKTFMTQWQEEAAVVQDAVEEVKGIRDEIVAARAEIASTMNTARQDVTGGLADAQQALTEAKADVIKRVDDSRKRTAAELAGRTESGETRAAAQTQEILDKALAGRSEAPESEETPDTTEEIDPDKERAEMLRNVKEAFQARAAAQETPEQPKVDAAQPTPSTQALASPRTRKEGEDAFSKSQQILASLQAKREGTQQKEADVPVEDSAQGESEKTPPAPASIVSPVQPSSMPVTETEEQGTEIEVPVPLVGPQEFQKLNSQVARLEDQIQSLREEIQALRAGTASRESPTTTDEKARATEQETAIEPTTESSTAVISVEELA